MRFAIHYGTGEERRYGHCPIYTVSRPVELFDRLMRIRNLDRITVMRIELKRGRAFGWKRGWRTLAASDGEVATVLRIFTNRLTDPDYLEELAAIVWERAITHQRLFEIG